MILYSVKELLYASETSVLTPRGDNSKQCDIGFSIYPPEASWNFAVTQTLKTGRDSSN